MTIEGIVIVLIIGAIAGWLAGVIVKGGGFGLLGNIVVGIIGAAIGGFLLGSADINDGAVTINTFLVSLLGAVVLLAVVNLVRRGAVR